MFRSLASSIFTLIAVVLFAFVLIFLWNGSSSLQFQRVAMEGDKPTAVLIAEYQKKISNTEEVSMQPKKDTEEKPVVQQSSGDGPPVVLWISIAGFRGDYLEKAETPTFDELAANGGSTNKMRPSFPCLTFPSHITSATGVPVSKHGIVADKIRLEDGTIADHPTDSSLILSEPIWKTATRQGIKTLVYDWPLSQEQPGENAAAAFSDSFNPDETDKERLDKVLAAWKGGSGGGAGDSTDASGTDDEKKADGETGGETDSEQPAAAAGGGGGGDKFQLVMLRLDDIGRAGLKNGPRSDDTYGVINATDKALGEFIAAVRGDWDNLAPANANLYILVTTDHGMAELEKNVNVPHLLGDEIMKNFDVIAHDAVANLYFKDMPESEGEQKLLIKNLDDALKKNIFYRTYTQEDIPEDYSYVAKGRVGDRILVLKSGYGFTEMKSEEPVFDPSEGPGFFGGFGYPVLESIRMSGQVIFAGFPNAPAEGKLDEIQQTVFHATVCKLLGIQPAEGAATETLPIKGK